MYNFDCFNIIQQAIVQSAQRIAFTTNLANKLSP